MGHTLSEPVTTKETTSCASSLVKVGSSCMQGWRITMEDVHTQLLSVNGDRNTCFFAIFDGHGGHKIAQYAGMHLHKKITSHPGWSDGRVEGAIKEGFMQLDDEMSRDEALKNELAGSTGITVIVKDNTIFCGNVGDSRAIASVGGRVHALSLDHKPANEAEAKRIVAAGGWVEFNRVNGNLALSRALGDFVFKKNEARRAEEQIITAEPDVTTLGVTDDLEFIVMACDGIWDVLTNQEVVDLVRLRIARRMEPEMICEELMMRCLAPECQWTGVGCDNMTVIIITFLHGGTYNDLAAKCQRPSNAGPAASIINPLPL